MEYTKFGGVVKATNKGKIERAIMKENSKRFQLVYASPVFNRKIIN